MSAIKLPRPQTLEELRALCAVTNDAGACWIWLGKKIPSGYGCIGATTMHRYAFLLSRGHEAKNLVCHTCDVKLCCNPDHVYDGTKSSNQKDAIARGLSKKPPRKPAKINDEKLRFAALLLSGGSTLTRAAESIGVRYQTLQTPRNRQKLNDYMLGGVG